MPEDRVAVRVSGAVAEVTLNRPDKLNALDNAMFAALASAAADLAGRREVRAVVLAGSGRAFCAGIDLTKLGADADGGAGAIGSLEDRTHGIANLFQQAAWAWRELPVPVIEARWGLVPDMGGIALLRGLVRDDVARELTYTARQVSGTEAVALGLATRTAEDPRAAAVELATQIAAGSPRALRAAKRLFAVSRDAGAAAILLAESREQQDLLTGPDIPEMLAAHAEGRPPRFAD